MLNLILVLINALHCIFIKISLCVQCFSYVTYTPGFIIQSSHSFSLSGFLVMTNEHLVMGLTAEELNG